MKKKIVSTLLVLCMVLTLLPGTATAEQRRSLVLTDGTSIDLEQTASNEDETWGYSTSTRTLTLSGFTGQGAYIPDSCLVLTEGTENHLNRLILSVADGSTYTVTGKGALVLTAPKDENEEVGALYIRCDNGRIDFSSMQVTGGPNEGDEQELVLTGNGYVTTVSGEIAKYVNIEPKESAGNGSEIQDPIISEPEAPVLSVLKGNYGEDLLFYRGEGSKQLVVMGISCNADFSERAKDPANWNIDTEGTGLTLSSLEISGRRTVSFIFDGTALVGSTLKIQALAGAFAAGGINSGELSIPFQSRKAMPVNIQFVMDDSEPRVPIGISWQLSFAGSEDTPAGFMILVNGGAAAYSSGLISNTPQEGVLSILEGPSLAPAVYIYTFDASWNPSNLSAGMYSVVVMTNSDVQASCTLQIESVEEIITPPAVTAPPEDYPASGLPIFQPPVDTTPVTPSKPGTPAKPEQPAKPEIPAEPEQPAEPAQPAEPEIPVQPEQPGVPEPVFIDVAPTAWYSEAASYNVVLSIRSVPPPALSVGRISSRWQLI